MIGGGWIYGNVDENGDHTGHDIAYIYNDLSTAWLGHFEKGVMVKISISLLNDINCTLRIIL